MEDSFVCLDLFPHIIKYCNYSTLTNFKKVNYFCYHVVKKEQKKRLKSIFPFGEENAKIQVFLKDIYIEKINCIIDENTIEIPREKYSMFYIREVLDSWFTYHFPIEKWILTGKIIKAIIRLANKEKEKEHIGEVLTFECKNMKTYLSEV